MKSIFPYLIMVVLLLATIQISNGQTNEEVVVLEKMTPVQAQPAKVSVSSSNNLPRMSLMLDAGYNWRTAKIWSELDDFQKHVLKQVMSGFQWNGSLTYYFKKRMMGVGIKFQQFMASYEAYGSDMSTGQTGTYKISDRITFVGPAYMMQSPLGKTNFLFDMCASIGYIGLTDKQSFANEKSTVTGNSVGVHMSGGLSYRITPQLGIGCKLSLNNGTLFKFKVTDQYGNTSTEKLDSDKGESLSQFGVSFGIRYYINSK